MKKVAESDSSNNILNISSKLKKQISEGRILPKIYELLISCLKPTILSYYDHLDDALFNMAEKAESNELQSDYFFFMNEIRKKKDLMLRKFTDRIQTVFNKFNNSDYKFFPGTNDTTATDSSNIKLSLIDEHELDYKLAISNMVGKADTHLHQQLYAFQKRFSLLAGGKELKNDQIPVSPFVIVESFARTLEHLVVTGTVELIILKLFERNLIPNLIELYHKINSYLIEQGILPSLKFQPLPEAANRLNSASANSNREIKKEQPSLTNNDHRLNYNQNNQVPGEYYDENYQLIFDAFRQMQNQDMISSPNTYGSRVDFPVYDAPKINKALLALRNIEINSGDSLQPIFSPTELKNALLKQLEHSASGKETKRVKQQDEDTIDLVGMLFQFLVDDRNLPDKIQALLAKLQIPYLHIALQDRRIFSNKENSARKLLDNLAQAAIGWNEKNDKKGKFINKIKQIVYVILNSDYNDIDFSGLIDDFQKFFNKEQKRVYVSEKRTSEKALAQDKILKAKEATAQILQSRMKKFYLPKNITEILLNSWASVLTLIHLRHKDKPEIIDKYIKFVDKLIFASVQNKKVNATPTQIKNVINHYCEGLKLVAYDEPGIKKKGLELYEQLLEINDLKAIDRKFEHEYIHAVKLFEEIDENAEKPDIFNYLTDNQIQNKSDTEIKHIEDSYLDTAKRLKPGDWVEFATEQKNKLVRAKLSWISPITHKLLFVDSKGIKVSDKSLNEVALNFRQKTAIIIEQKPIFDRAMIAIAKKVTTKCNQVN